MRKATTVILLGLFIGGGLGASQVVIRAMMKQAPDLGSVVTQVRDVARLETLDVVLYKKITFTPDPEIQGAFWSDVFTWVRYSLRAPRGKAIVFAVAHLGIDLARLDTGGIWIDGRSVYVNLPPIQVTVELKPGDTEIVDSNLDSAETSKLYELAREAFVREVEADAKLKERAQRIGLVGIIGVGNLDKAIPASERASFEPIGTIGRNTASCRLVGNASETVIRVYEVGRVGYRCIRCTEGKAPRSGIPRERVRPRGGGRLGSVDAVARFVGFNEHVFSVGARSRRRWRARRRSRNNLCSHVARAGRIALSRPVI